MDLRFLSGNFVSGSVASDYVFKQVFGKQENEKILISFLNAMLDGDLIVKSVKILNTELPRTSDTSKNILLDVQAQVDNGTYVDIEVQQGYTKDLLSRMSVYGARMISKYSKKGTPFDNTRCIAIWLLNCNIPSFKMFNNDRIQGEIHFKSLERNELSLPVELLKIYPIELKKGANVKKYSEIKRGWIEFLRSSSDVKKSRGIEILTNAYDKMQRITGTEQYRNYMEAVEKAEEVERNKLAKVRKEGVAEGLAEGKKKGLAEGVKKGRVEGLAEGEHKKAIETAKRMLFKGSDIEFISKCTGLSTEVIKTL